MCGSLRRIERLRISTFWDGQGYIDAGQMNYRSNIVLAFVSLFGILLLHDIAIQICFKRKMSSVRG